MYTLKPTNPPRAMKFCPCVHFFIVPDKLGDHGIRQQSSINCEIGVTEFELTRIKVVMTKIQEEH